MLSDTHGFLDPAILAYFAGCDEIWHAGDFGTLAIFEELERFRPLRSVWGNVDDAAIRASVPQDLHWDCAGMKVYMTHISGYPGAWDRRVKKILVEERPNLVIGGHSHILRVMRDPTLQMLYLNPGAAGHHGWHTQRTLLRFEIEEGKVHGLEAIELGGRGRRRAQGSSATADSD